MIEVYVNKLVPFETDEVAFDIETSGLDAHIDRIWCVQISDGKTVVVLTHLWKPEFLDYIKNIVETKLLVGHNLAFDVKFLFKLGFKPWRVYDTMLMEQLLTAGRQRQYDLGSVAEEYGIRINKEARKDFHTPGVLPVPAGYPHGIEELPRDLIEYAARDVVHLLAIAHAQRSNLSWYELNTVSKLENKYLLVAASISYSGLMLDDSRASEYESMIDVEMKARGGKLIAALNKPYLARAMRQYEARKRAYEAWKARYDEIANAPGAKAKLPKKNGAPGTSWQYTPEVRRQLEAMKKHEAAKNPRMPERINLESPKHIVMALQELGFRINESSSHDELVELSKDSPLAEEIVQYRTYSTLKKILKLRDKLNTSTNRLHPKIRQMLVTGRQATSEPNLLAVPVRSKEGKLFRALFIPTPGYKFIAADYAAIELVILFAYCGEEEALQLLKDGKDLHSYTLAQIIDSSRATEIESAIKLAKNKQPIPEDEYGWLRDAVYRAFYLPDLKELPLDAMLLRLRDYIKTLTYGVSYGMSEYGLSRRLHCDLDSAKRIINLFFSVYPSLRRYVDSLGNYAVDCFRTRPILDGRFRWFDELDEDDKDTKEYWRQYFKIRRQAGNYVAQATCASMLKLAAIYFIDKYRPYNEDAHILLTIHDEILVEAKEEIAAEAAAVLKSSMEKAASVYLRRDDLVRVKPAILDKWEKA
jgi:DNA polymerase I-like protein with 3'-5' exonuclease and polymerase domains